MRTNTLPMASILLLLVASPRGAQSQPSQPDHEERETPAIRFVLGKHPSLRVGGLRVDFRARFQGDWRDFASDASPRPDDVFDLHRARIGIEGTFLKYLEYQVERELSDRSGPWRDVYLNLRPAAALQIQAGAFKIPFSLDQLTSSTELDFPYRSLAGTYLTPGRDVGIMAHGSLFKGGMKYQTGVFRQGGENVRQSERADPQSDRTVAGRVAVRPWDKRRAPQRLRTLSVGGAFTFGNVPEGLNSVRGHSVAEEPLFHRVYVHGLRRRIGGEVEWRPGPISLRGEIVRVYDQRRDEGTDDDDLPEVAAGGWYLSGTWLVTGERKAGDVEPARAFLRGGLGALELASRIEAIHFGSRASPHPPSRDLRARNILEDAEQVWTFGVNWYLNRRLKAQFNVIRARRKQGGVAVPDRERLWSRLFRVQLAL